MYSTVVILLVNRGRTLDQTYRIEASLPLIDREIRFDRSATRQFALHSPAVVPGAPPRQPENAHNLQEA